MKYRFILQPYKGITSRYNCPKCNQKKCFSRYIDTENRIKFPEYVGRCNREQKCGYHFTPKYYFEQHPENKEKSHFLNHNQISPIEPPSQTSYLDFGIIQHSMSNYNQNRLYQFLVTLFGENESLRLMHQYMIGTSNHWPGATIFWQIDIAGRIRTGKIMLYNHQTGKRIKDPHTYITWVHSLLHKESYHLKQCFFGEHLLSADRTRPVAIVESEKTALIASYYLPQYLWIATGGKNGCFREENEIVLRGRNVVLFPDLGATDKWASKVLSMKKSGINAILFDYLEINATKEQKENGYDIADFLIEIRK